MFDSDVDSFIAQFIGDTKGLFDSKRSFNTPPGQTAQKPGDNAIPSAGGYTAPIHDNWASSGGFDLTSKRPNGRIGHQGVDMRCPIGTPVYPLAPGVVSSVGTDPIGGNVVNVQHANGVRTYYAHLSTAKVQKGDKVTTNTVLGTVGMTGNAKGTVPHLHFQVWKDGQIQDPAKYFSVPAYTNLSAEEKQRGIWLSPQAKQEAEAFNMKDHIANRKTAFSKEVDKLMKLAYEYCKFIDRSK
jgi:murein DD-endopeptidase MepM/ murein hydrolase activator NlpD